MKRIPLTKGKKALVEKIKLTRKMIQRGSDGVAQIVFPPGCIELCTNDELRFDCDGLMDLLK